MNEKMSNRIRQITIESLNPALRPGPGISHVKDMSLLLVMIPLSLLQ